jgi:hypothetical protein
VFLAFSGVLHRLPGADLAQKLRARNVFSEAG